MKIEAIYIAFTILCFCSLCTLNKGFYLKEVRAAEGDSNQSDAENKDEIIKLGNEMSLLELIQKTSEITGETFLVDQSVKAKNVNIITPKGEIPKQNIMVVFETILDLNGFAIVKKGVFNKIIPKKDIKTESIPVATDSD